MAEYKCKKCGYVSNQPVKDKPLNLKNKGNTTIEQMQKKCCPVCGAEQSEFGPVEQEDKVGRYD